jgi:hypothetical protein
MPSCNQIHDAISVSFIENCCTDPNNIYVLYHLFLYISIYFKIIVFGALSKDKISHPIPSINSLFSSV